MSPASLSADEATRITIKDGSALGCRGSPLGASVGVLALGIVHLGGIVPLGLARFRVSLVNPPRPLTWLRFTPEARCAWIRAFFPEPL